MNKTFGVCFLSPRLIWLVTPYRMFEVQAQFSTWYWCAVCTHMEEMIENRFRSIRESTPTVNPKKLEYHQNVDLFLSFKFKSEHIHWRANRRLGGGVHGETHAGPVLSPQSSLQMNRNMRFWSVEERWRCADTKLLECSTVRDGLGRHVICWWWPWNGDALAPAYTDRTTIVLCI